MTPGPYGSYDGAPAADFAAQAEKLERMAALAEMQALNAQAAQLERRARLVEEAAQLKKMAALAEAEKLNARAAMLEQRASGVEVDEERLNRLLLGVEEEEEPQADSRCVDLRSEVGDAFRAALLAAGMTVPVKPRAPPAAATRPWETQRAAPTGTQWAAVPGTQRAQAPWSGCGSSASSTAAPGRTLTFTPPGARLGGLLGSMSNTQQLRDIASRSWGSAEDSHPLARLQADVPTFEDIPRPLCSDMADEPPAQETLQRRAELEVVVDGSAAHPIDLFHEAVGIPEYALQAIANMGIAAPLPIQAQALPIALAGRDLVGIARTGSGKTIAFLLPCVVHLEALGVLLARRHGNAVAPSALVLAPTRELAIQIADTAKALCQGSGGQFRGMGLQTVCVFGGGNKESQVNELWHGCHIVVATPGRLTDLLAAGTVTLDRVTYFVLDEADRMMDQGFAAEVQEYSRRIRPDRQMLFFSATWPPVVQELARSLCHGGQRPVTLKVGQAYDGGVATRADICQEVIVFEQATWDERDLAKQLVLYEHLRQVLQFAEAKVLVFVSRKALADDMKYKLSQEGFCTDAMHGGRPQQERMNVLERFRNSEVKLLVATDVMGRGLDIPDVTHVVIYDMSELEDYVHRIGRTCRGPDGQAGHALTFFEYDKRWPNLASELIKVLQESNQGVPEDLLAVAGEVDRGLREKSWVGGKRKAGWSSSPWQGSSASGWSNAALASGNTISGLLGAQLASARSGGAGNGARGKCKFFGSARGCSDGDACSFSHADALHVAVCEWHTEPKGCQYGDQCMFRHPGADPAGGEEEPTLEATLEQATLEFFRQQLLRRKTG